ncbi:MULTISPECIES: MarR family winged helix-turn-helix transcriptional regulator [Deinococcus]|uniref:MarR family winged helix-turn-helix transcriptional regulator n=1 Tax=Deinococcus rufus TaxID=2136097 RepID=A0ABV7Z6T0_9DEIO|nr:MarR family winged helix-turn-helix transcriptional regulator [Deinococcus sp. AB2017081]WQE96050.1 MarR family winged helix-turn-helix transcriptional regulator [Deinococcus sp. AB2017081]
MDTPGVTPDSDLHAQPLRFLTAYWGVWQSMSGRANADLAAHGLDLRSFIALSYVQGSPTSPGELARVLDVPRYEMTRILDRLTALGTITRELDPTSARSRRLDVTPAGRAQWEAALQAVTATVDPALTSLGSRLEPLTASLEHLAAFSYPAPQETP